MPLCPPPRSSFAVPVAFVLLLAGTAQGQSNKYTLDESGQWATATAPAPGSDAAIIADARRALADGRAAAAQSILDTWIEANERTDKAELAEAYLLRGDAITAGGDEFKALYDYEAVCKQYPGSPEFVRAIERELDIGVRYVNGLRRKLLGMRITGAFDVGEELLIRVQERLPGSRLGERAIIELADAYYRTRDMEMAAEAYDLFVRNFPKSPYVSKAMQRQIYASIARFKGPRYDATSLVDASVLIDRYQRAYPAQAQDAGLDDALQIRLDESVAVAMLEQADWYLRTGDEAAARLVLRRLVVKHSRTTAAQTGLDELTKRGWLPPPPAPPTPPTTPGPDAKPAPGGAPGETFPDPGTAPVGAPEGAAGTPANGEPLPVTPRSREERLKSMRGQPAKSPTAGPTPTPAPEPVPTPPAPPAPGGTP